MAKFKLQWNIHTKTKTEAKALKVIAEFAARIEQDIRVLNSQPYLKIEGTFENSAESTIEADSARMAAYSALRDLARVSGPRNLLGPHEEGDAVHLEVICSECAPNGLEWIHLTFEHGVSGLKT